MSFSRSATLAQVVAGSLEESIKDGVYLCGDRLVEISIAQEMNVSQNTVRDALSILEEAGWVVKKPRYGVTLRTFSTDEAKELYTLRAALEKIALGWALENMSAADRMGLGQMLSEARLHAGMGHHRHFQNALFGLHTAIIHKAAKPYTTQLLSRMQNHCRLLEQIRARYDPHSADTYADMLTDYGELITAIRYDRRKAAQDLIHDIIMHNGHTLFPVLDLIR